MISFNYLTEFRLENEKACSEWIARIIEEEGYRLDFINYIFCNDEYLHKLNKEYLDHDTLTDVIGFDYSVGKELQGDIYISTERVHENAAHFKVGFTSELYRVMAHGILHFCGYQDKNDEAQLLMRDRENHYLSLLSQT